MKIVFYVFITISFLLITFFGLGPVAFADGTMSERLMTLSVVVLLYLSLIMAVILFVRNQKKSGK